MSRPPSFCCGWALWPQGPGPAGPTSTPYPAELCAYAQVYCHRCLHGGRLQGRCVTSVIRLAEGSRGCTCRNAKVTSGSAAQSLQRLSAVCVTRLIIATCILPTDIPPAWVCVLLGMQHFLTMLGSTVVIPSLLVPAMGGTRKGMWKIWELKYHIRSLGDGAQKQPPLFARLQGRSLNKRSQAYYCYMLC